MERQIPSKKTLGQHWLDDEVVLSKMCDAADVRPGDMVLEIGPGPGSLTAQLIKRGAKVVAVEKDDRLIQGLRQRFEGQPLSVHAGDILEYDLTGLPADYKVVANIPYYLTSNLLTYLCSSPNPFDRAAILMQREVAERAAAKPGNMSLLSLNIQMVAEISLGDIVEAALFSPPPKVDSRILILKRRRPLPSYALEKGLRRLMSIAFSQKRKTLANSLSRGLRIPRTDVEEILNSVGISPLTRPQALALEQWQLLYENFAPLLRPDNT
jgi:16S rRNA (adenine1518-N6/adenine1519-N6)-dimethyltransferase